MADDKQENKSSGKENFSNKGHQMTTPNQMPSKRPDPVGPVADED